MFKLFDNTFERDIIYFRKAGTNVYHKRILFIHIRISSKENKVREDSHSDKYNKINSVCCYCDVSVK